MEHLEENKEEIISFIRFSLKITSTYLPYHLILKYIQRTWTGRSKIPKGLAWSTSKVLKFLVVWKRSSFWNAFVPTEETRVQQILSQWQCWGTKEEQLGQQSKTGWIVQWQISIEEKKRKERAEVGPRSFLKSLRLTLAEDKTKQPLQDA